MKWEDKEEKVVMRKAMKAFPAGTLKNVNAGTTGVTSGQGTKRLTFRDKWRWGSWLLASG